MSLIDNCNAQLITTCAVQWRRQSAADPEIWNKGRKGMVKVKVKMSICRTVAHHVYTPLMHFCIRGGIWLSRKFLKILSKNNAFSAKFSLVLRCIRSIGGRPPLWIRHCRQGRSMGPSLPQSSRQDISIRLNYTKWGNLVSLFLGK